MSLKKPVNCLIIFLFLTGCGTLPRPTPPLVNYIQDPDSVCINDYTKLDSYVAGHGIADVQDRRIPGFPYLRMNRFLASFSDRPMTDVEEELWVKQLAQLDLGGRQVELGAIPLPELQRLVPHAADQESLLMTLQDCSNELVSQLLADKEALQELRRRTEVPDNYLDFMRIAGLYPLTSLPVMLGVQQLHKQTRARLEEPFPGNTDHQIKRYAPASDSRLSAAEISSLIHSAGNNPLEIPLFSNRELMELFRYFAPVFEVETAGNTDLPGYPVWGKETSVTIDTARPVVFTHLSHARFHGRVLVQLNYTLWFPERPLAGSLDLLGGHLDGITWRVTLDESGRPMIYDIIHNCGCYHMVFAAEALRRRETSRFWQEPMLVFPLPDRGGDNVRAVLSIASGNHYLAEVRHTQLLPADRQYRLVDYDRLRQLPYKDGITRSMFDEHGLVPGTERAERWLLWPMGVPEPGAMRQWGHHAIAFVGRRHFDDPFLWEQYFTLPD